MFYYIVAAVFALLLFMIFDKRFSLRYRVVLLVYRCLNALGDWAASDIKNLESFFGDELSTKSGSSLKCSGCGKWTNSWDGHTTVKSERFPDCPNSFCLVCGKCGHISEWVDVGMICVSREHIEENEARIRKEQIEILRKTMTAKRTKMTAILAHSSNMVIGNKGEIPWKCPDDMRQFKLATLNNVVIMGHATWKSFDNKRLANRINVVMSRSKGKVEGTPDKIVGSITELADYIETLDLDQKKLYVIGGAEIYSLLIDACDDIRASEIPVTVDGDTFVPANLFNDFTLFTTEPRASKTQSFTLKTWVRWAE
jgi:dihydrofolate reductase